jgi:hypothetical protein
VEASLSVPSSHPRRQSNPNLAKQRVCREVMQVRLEPFSSPHGVTIAEPQGSHDATLAITAASGKWIHVSRTTRPWAMRVSR